MPPVNVNSIPGSHRERLEAHYRALNAAHPLQDFERVEVQGKGALWRHPAVDKEPHELRHEALLATQGHTVVSLPENFPGQPGAPPDLELDGVVAQLAYRRDTRREDSTVRMQRNIRKGRKTAPMVVYVIDEEVKVTIPRLDGLVEMLFAEGDRLGRVLVYRETAEGLAVIYDKSNESNDTS